MLARLGALAVEPAPGTDADRIDRIAAFEQLRGALAAAQHAEMVAFARSQVEAAHRRRPARPAPRSGAGSATRSGWPAASRPSTAPDASASPAPCTSTYPASGICWRRGGSARTLAETVVSETRHLDAEHRRLVDKQLCDAGLDRLSPRPGGRRGQTAGLRGRPRRVHGPRPHRPQGPPGRAAPRTRHHERALRAPAGRAGRGVPGRAAQAHRRRRRRRRRPHPRPDHGRHPRRTRHRTSPRRRRQRRGRHRDPRSTP